MFDELLKIVGDVTKVVEAPLAVARETVTKPAADAAKAVTETVKEIVDLK